MFLKIEIEKGCYLNSYGTIYPLQDDSAVLLNIDAKGKNKIDAITPSFARGYYKLCIGDYCSVTADNNEILTNYIDVIARAMADNAPVSTIAVSEGNAVRIFDRT